jgi:hypothetical protein
VSRWSTACDERSGHLPLVCYTSGADVTEYRATLMTHHLRAQPPDHPGAEARRRHSIHHELGNYMTCHDRAFEQRFQLAVISRERP